VRGGVDLDGACYGRWAGGRWCPVKRRRARSRGREREDSQRQEDELRSGATIWGGD
jgi:hypothetical protein